MTDLPSLPDHVIVRHATGMLYLVARDFSSIDGPYITMGQALAAAGLADDDTDRDDRQPFETCYLVAGTVSYGEKHRLAVAIPIAAGDGEEAAELAITMVASNLGAAAAWCEPPQVRALDEDDAGAFGTFIRGMSP